MKRLPTILLTAAALFARNPAQAAPNLDFAVRVGCDFQQPERGLMDLHVLQGSTPLVLAMPKAGNVALTPDPDTSVRMIIGPTETGSIYAVRTNSAIAGGGYAIDWPTIGTNSSGRAWFYTLLFDREGKTYWSGSGALYIDASGYTGPDGVEWIEYTTPNTTWQNILGDDPSANAALKAYIEASALQAVPWDEATTNNMTGIDWGALGGGEGGGEDWSTYPATNPVNGGGQVFSNLSLASPKITGTIRNAWNEPIISSSEIGNDGELVVGYQFVTGRYNQVRLPAVGPVKIGRQGEQGTNIVIMDDDGFRYLFGTNVLAVKTNMTLNGIPVGQGAGDGGAASNVIVAATPVNYSPADTNVEAHLAGIDTRLGEIGLTNFFFGQPWRVITNDYTVDTNHTDYAIGADTLLTNLWLTLPDIDDRFATIVVRKFTNTNALYIIRNSVTNWTLYEDGDSISYDWWPHKTNWYWRAAP